MATGQSIQLTGKIGEHLVTAKLATMGITATPFAGNVPEIDILAYANRRAIPIQVKTINLRHGGAWQFDIRRFLDVEISNNEQEVLGIKKDFNRGLLCIFVALKGPLETAEFYVLMYGWLQDYFSKTYRARKPPHKVTSFHCAIWKKDMKRHLNKWPIVYRAFQLSPEKQESQK